uniref:Tetratricopeptide repeat protein n=1 Tax=Desulfobacca acetoxidans TaxID=60893 RepID=A0A7V4GA75_9BACT
MSRRSWRWGTSLVAWVLLLILPAPAAPAEPQVIKGRSPAPAAAREADRAYEQGLQAVAAGDYTRAVRTLQEVVKQKPEAAEAHYQLGLAYAGQGETDKAVASLEAALRQQPGLAPARVKLGEIYGERGLKFLREGEAVKAEAQLKAALQQNPQDDMAMSNLGVALGQQGRWAEAREAFQEAVTRNPNNTQAQFNLGVTCYLAGDKDGTTRQYALLSLLDPEAAAELFRLIQQTSSIAAPFRF